MSKVFSPLKFPSRRPPGVFGTSESPRKKPIRPRAPPRAQPFWGGDNGYLFLPDVRTPYNWEKFIKYFVCSGGNFIKHIKWGPVLLFLRFPGGNLGFKPEFTELSSFLLDLLGILGFLGRTRLKIPRNLGFWTQNPRFSNISPSKSCAKPSSSPIFAARRRLSSSDESPRLDHLRDAFQKSPQGIFEKNQKSKKIDIHVEIVVDDNFDDNIDFFRKMVLLKNPLRGFFKSVT